MRTCPSCGKANNPIRKYCVRCGKSLLISKGEETVKKSTPPAKQPEVTDTVVQKPIKEMSTSAATDGLSVTTDDQWVKPSEVQRERMRTTSSSRGKSEMEKAREAFARAEKVGVQYEEGDIVETRMLRASEVREFMQEASPQPAPAQPSLESQSIQHVQRPAERPPGQPPVSTGPPGTTMPPGGVVGGPPRQTVQIPPASNTMPTDVKPVQKIEPSSPKIAAATVKHQDAELSAAKRIEQAPPIGQVKTTPEPRVMDTQVKEMDAILGCIAHSEDLQDNKIKDLLNELTNLHREMQQVTANQISITTQLDARVRESQNKAEVKRISYESINEQLRLAKQEWDDAKDEFDKAESRRKREISTLDDRVKNIQKRIEKAEGSVKKRVGELDKVREKIAQLQNQES